MKINWQKWWEKWSNFKANPKQLEAEKLIEKYDYFLYGGASGGGKSYLLRKYPIKYLIKYCWHELGLKGVRVALFCENYPALWDRHLCKIPYEFPKWLGEYQAQKHEFVLKEQFGGGVYCFRNLDDPSKYASSEFALIAVDELTKNTKDTFDLLRWRKRWTGVPRTKFIGGTNPGGIGHGWVKKLWLDRNFPPEEKEKDQFYFLQAKANDNTYLDKSYFQILDSLPEKLRKAYRDGNWDVFVGQYFTEWDREKHVTVPFPIPKSWKKFRSYDYGREKPACCKWYALDYDGRLWVYREFYKAGLDVDQQAKEIVRLSGDEVYEYSVADPSIFARTGIVDKWGGETIAQTFAKHGIDFYPASTRRIDGWNLMHQYLRWDEQNPPKMIYFNTCYDSIRTIPTLIHDERKPEDIDTKGEDHCLSGETIIHTTKGNFEIKKLVGKTGFVYTPQGIKRFFNVRKTGENKTLWKIKTKRKEIIATDEHKILLKDGWRKLKDIKVGDEILDIGSLFLIELVIWKSKLFLQQSKNLMEKGIICVENIFKEKVLGCIEKFGNIIMEKFLQPIQFTTKIITEPIIKLPIFNFLKKESIYIYIPLQKKERHWTDLTLKNMPNQKQFYGINQKKEENGIQNIQKKLPKNGNGLRKNVLFVVNHIKHLFNLVTGQNIAILIAKLQRYAVVEELSQLKEKADVYDMEVEDAHCFAINGGLVVHNCADCDRYLLMSLHEQKTSPPLTEVERKLARLKMTSGLDFKIYYPET
uniref:Hint domain-containing protein n=1 Tax=candidate division CPR3 bacterium TaxID=2268181 RepID=A0A7V3N5F1_UNCC3